MSLDVFQQVFEVSIGSNKANDYKGTQTDLQRALQVYLTSFLPEKVGAEWQLAWGPVVWKNEPENAETGPDNTWYIAFHPNLQFEDGSVHPTYVIAIAGTPRKSDYDWVHQNFAVDTVVDFRSWVASGIQNPAVPATSIVQGSPYIASGTANGVQILSSNPAPSGAVAAGTTLPDFVANVDTSDSPRFIFTGHSLGGALSPSLAFSLVLNGSIPGSNTLAYPTAGASPGNTDFTDLFTQTLPSRKSDGASSYQGWNLNLVNTLDIVPQAWSTTSSISPEQNLGNIPQIYGLPVIPFVQGITSVFKYHAARSGVLYQPIQSQYFTGSPPSAVPTNTKEFIDIAGHQHVDAYLSEASIPIPWPGKLIGHGITEKTEIEKRYNDPVIAQLEWALQHPKEAWDIIRKVEDSAEAKALLTENA